MLAEIEADRVPELLVLQQGRLAPDAAKRLLVAHPGSVACSGLTGQGTGDLLSLLAERLREHDTTVELAVPYERGDVLAALHRAGEVVEQRDAGEVIVVRARLDEAGRRRFASFARPGRPATSAAASRRRPNRLRRARRGARLMPGTDRR